MSNFTKPKGVRANGIPYGTQISAKADREITEDGDSRLSKTYAIHIRLDYPCPSPRNSTTRMIGDKFVWEKLFECRGRANAVLEAGDWFRHVKQSSTGKNATRQKKCHECVVVDDPWNECSYGSEFNPIRPLNRLMDEKTKERIIEESKGNLEVAKWSSDVPSNFRHPSLEWVKGTEKINTKPIKVGLNTMVDPSLNDMKYAMNKAVEREKARKKNNNTTWLKEVESIENRRLIKKMRENGTLEHSSAYRKRVGERLEQPKILKKKKVSAKQKKILKAELDEWIAREEKNSLKRRKNKS
jgi:hypothetical protein